MLYALRGLFTSVLARSLPAELSEHVYRTADEINDAAFTLLDELVEDRRPFFLFLNYMDAHEPYRPPPPFDRRWPDKDDSFRRRDYQRLEREVLSLERPLHDRERGHLVSQYDGGIAYRDSKLEELFEVLRQLGVFDDALVVVTADHGEAFGERSLVGHQSSVYQDQVHVPLVVKLPRQRERRWIDRPVSIADLFPTLLESAGRLPPPEIDGVSLFAPPANSERLILSESFPNHYLVTWHPRFHRVERAVVSASGKLILSTAGKLEAHDLASDPAELAPRDPGDEPFPTLAQRLAEWLRLHPLVSSLGEHQLDAETRARLRSLGYL